MFRDLFEKPFDDKNVYTLIVLLLILLVMTYFYNIYKQKLEQEDVKFSYTEITRFLSNTEKHNKPILWIFIDYQKNARNWESFYSRNTFALNQGYIFLTVRTIIERCKKDFHICLIDDNVFHKLLNGKFFNDMNKKSLPNKEYVRVYGICQLLYTYGGILVPASFICFKNLKSLLQNNKMFVGEFQSKTLNSSLFAANYFLMGCQKENNVMGELIDYLKREIVTDFTSEPQFVGKISIWLALHIKNHQINLISGHQIGTRKKDGTAIETSELLSNNFINIDVKKVLGIYIPQKELLERVQFGWFSRLSVEQLLKSNTFIGKMLLLNGSYNMKKMPYFSIH